MQVLVVNNFMGLKVPIVWLGQYLAGVSLGYGFGAVTAGRCNRFWPYDL